MRWQPDLWDAMHYGTLHLQPATAPALLRADMLDEAGDEGPEAEVAALDAASLLGVSSQGAELIAGDASGEGTWRSMLPATCTHASRLPAGCQQVASRLCMPAGCQQVASRLCIPAGCQQVVHASRLPAGCQQVMHALLSRAPRITGLICRPVS